MLEQSCGGDNEKKLDDDYFFVDVEKKAAKMLIYTSFQTVSITFTAHKPDFDQLDELILKYPDNQEVIGTVHFASFIAFTS